MKGSSNCAPLAWSTVAQLVNRLATLGVQIMPRLKAMIMMYLVSVLLTFASRFWILL